MYQWTTISLQISERDLCHKAGENFVWEDLEGTIWVYYMDGDGNIIESWALMAAVYWIKDLSRTVSSGDWIVVERNDWTWRHMSVADGKHSFEPSDLAVHDKDWKLNRAYMNTVTYNLSYASGKMQREDDKLVFLGTPMLHPYNPNYQHALTRLSNAPCSPLSKENLLQ